MEHIAGQAERHPGFPHGRVYAPCKGKSFISISNIECFCPFRASMLWQSVTQGVASLALGYVLHWAFSPPLLNPKLELKFQLRFHAIRTAWHRIIAHHLVMVVEGIDEVGPQFKVQALAKAKGAQCRKAPFAVRR